MLIYKATNLINRKIYIGKTTQSLRVRRTGHLADVKRGKMYPFICAIRKYGVENFTWDVLEECNTQDELSDREIYWIKILDSQNRYIGYNIADGGKGGGNRKGIKLSDKTKQKISESKKGVKIGPHSLKTKKLISDSRKGIQFTDEHKKKLSISRKKRITTDETKNKMSKSMKGNINIKLYELTSPNGEQFITYNGLTSFCESYNLTPSNLHKVLKGARSHHKGWTIKMIDDK